MEKHVLQVAQYFGIGKIVRNLEHGKGIVTEVKPESILVQFFKKNNIIEFKNCDLHELDLKKESSITYLFNKIKELEKEVAHLKASN